VSHCGLVAGIAAPWWIADFFPNIESEIGLALVYVGMVPIYWPPRRQQP
jgi:hypothetical protein